MANILHGDIIPGTIIADSQTGATATRVFIVESDTAVQQAGGSILGTSGLPIIGDPHPYSQSGEMLCISRSVTMLGPGRHRVECQYSSEPSVTNKWRYSITGQTVEREGYNLEGYVTASGFTAPIINTLKPTHTSTDGKRDFNKTMPTVQPTVKIGLPSLTVVATKRDLITAIPVTSINYIVGHKNENTFDAIGIPPGNLLCTRITLDPIGNGYADFSVEFQYDAKEWKGETVYIDPQTGLPIEGATEGNGSAQKNIELYPSLDFGAYGIGS